MDMGLTGGAFQTSPRALLSIPYSNNKTKSVKPDDAYLKVIISHEASEIMRKKLRQTGKYVQTESQNSLNIRDHTDPRASSTEENHRRDKKPDSFDLKQYKRANMLSPSDIVSNSNSKWKMLLSKESLQQQTIKEENNNEEEEDDDDSDDSDDDNDNYNKNDKNEKNDKTGITSIQKDDDSDSDAESDENHVEMEIFTQELIIQKMPIIFLLYEFYFQNQYWYYANLWHTMLGYLSIVRIVLLILETCNGPNLYVGRENRAEYPFLPSSALYWTFQVICTVPLCIDTFFLLITLLIIIFTKKLFILSDNLRHNYFELIVVFCDIVCLIPFVITIFNPRIELQWTTVFRLLTLLVFGHLLRCSKVSPIFFAVRTALVRAGPRLLLPVFFFFCLNIVISVILYYIEPCYNIDTCGGQWKDLLDASFYALVTMCTVGYGNQTAYYITGRFLAVLLMIFGGAVFISLPLVIIGGEYDEAIALLDTFEKENEIQRKKHKKLRMQAFKLLGLSSHQSFISPDDNNMARRSAAKILPAVPTNPVARISKLLSGKVHRHDISNSAIFKCNKNIRNILRLAEKESKVCRHLSPLLLLCLSDLRSWVAILISHMDIAMEILDIEQDSNKNVLGRSLKSLIKNGIVVSNSNLQQLSTKTNTTQEILEELKESHYSVFQYMHKLVLRPLLVSFGLSSYLDSTLNNSITTENSVNEKKDGDSDSDNDNDKDIDDIEMDHISHLDALKYNKGDNVKAKNTRHEHLTKIVEATMNSHSIKNRLWLLIEVPESSWLARSFQFVIMICILLSILVLYTQSITTYVDYGESTLVCEKTVRFYCQDKDDPLLNPGCFVDNNGPTELKLEYNCAGSNCYGRGTNFGSYNSSVTCLSLSSRPFQDKESLDLFYGQTTFLTTRSKKHLQSDICKRIECFNNKGIKNINILWFMSEVLLTMVFTFECFARFFVSDSVTEYFLSFQNILDVISVLPFYFELIISIFTTNKLISNYSILASYIDNSILGLRSIKVIRLFKFGRHFLSTQVLIETVYKVFSQLLGSIFLLVAFSWLFSSILYELEKGRVCYVGDINCDPGNNQIEGQRTFINIKEAPSAFSNFFYSLWFSFVTLTSTGYGDIVPVTLAGQIITIAGTFLGQCWMTLPMTATGTTYYKLYNKFFNKLLQLEKLEKSKVDDDIHAFQPREKARLILFYKQLKHGEERLLRLMKYLKRPYDDDEEDISNKSAILQEFESIIFYFVRLFGADDSVQAQDLSRLGEACMESHIKLYDDIKAGK